MRAFDPAALFLAIIGLSDWIDARFLHLPTAAVTG
jgi:hypothetical protein